MNKNALLSGAIFGVCTVTIGAFGAHGLQPLLLANSRLDVFETAVQYQSIHVFALLFVGLLSFHIKSKWLDCAVMLFVSGMLIFSGSLYVLSISNIAKFGMITPIGGLLLIAGWVATIVAIAKANGK